MSHSMGINDGERLRLWRWAGGHTQRKAARLLGVSRWVVQNIESGMLPLTMIDDPAVHDGLGGVDAPWLQLRLARYRARRRRGLTALARALGVSRVTYLAWERAVDPRLVNFLKNKGYLPLK